MTEQATNSNLRKSQGQVVFEYILLALCLCVIALRTTLTESPNAPSTSQLHNLGDSLYSLSISAVPILLLVIWLVFSLCSKRFVYRPTSIEIGLCLFVIAAVIACFAAANKRAAITGSIVLLSPILMAVLLVQILDSHAKVKLLLIVIAALGMVSAYHCAEQFFISNQMDIAQYEKAPETILKPLGIEPDTFAHMLFEHRLYSEDVRGFFTTGNSVGAFAMLASFAAVALFIDKFKNRKSSPSGPLYLVTSAIVAAAVIFGLALAHSKGAIAAALIAAAMFALYLLFGNWLKTHKKVIMISCLMVIIAGGSIVVLYGLSHGRLPGGNSMLVRWQYWYGAAQMYTDHPLTGVGPGNFTNYYPHYKAAEALESVADPHNFLLSVLAQYGPLGLVGFLAIILIPLWKVIYPKRLSAPRKARHPPQGFAVLAAVFLVVILTAMLLIRPIVFPLPTDALPEEKKAAAVILYVMPAVVFALGFCLLAAGAKTSKRDTSNITVAALFCAAVSVLVHSLIDFAIFEPGVFSTLCAVIACLVALGFNANHRRSLALKPALFARVVVLAAGLIFIWAYFSYALCPVAKAGTKTKQAMQDARYIHRLLAQAAKDDPLDPAALNLNGRCYLEHYNDTGSKQPALLEQAAESFLGAINRNRADFKNFERLTEVYTLMAKTSSGQAKADWLKKALASASTAVERYPGCGRLRIELAKIAENLGNNQHAIDQYKMAIGIEEKYRRQFQIMYPGRNVFRRLGEDKYNFAIERIAELAKQPTPYPPGKNQTDGKMHAEFLWNLCSFRLYNKMKNYFCRFWDKCMVDEISVIRAVLRGDVDSFRLLVQRYERPVIAMIKNIIDDYHACEDIAQDVFLTAYKKLSSFDPARSSFPTWLFTIARNKSLNAAKKKRTLSMSNLPENPDSFTPANSLTQQEFFDRLAQVLQTLPAKQKTAFILAEFEKLPYEQVAQIEGVRIGTIKSRINRAKRKLRLALKSFEEDGL